MAAVNFYRTNAKAFLRAFAKCGHVERAAKISGVSKDVHYRWLKRYPEYRERYETAQKDAEARQLRLCEQELERRGREGVIKKVRDKNGDLVFDWLDAEGNYVPKGDPTAVRRVVAKERKHSDACLIFRMKKLDPNYRENHKLEVENTGQVQHNVTHGFDFDQFSRQFSEYARQRLHGERDAAAAGNGN